MIQLGRKKEPIYEYLGQKVRDSRIKRGLSQGELAEKVGLNRTSIVLIERGEQRVPIHRVVMIARALGVSVMVLIPDIEEEDIEGAGKIDKASLGRVSPGVAEEVMAIVERSKEGDNG